MDFAFYKLITLINLLIFLIPTIPEGKPDKKLLINQKFFVFYVDIE